MKYRPRQIGMWDAWMCEHQNRLQLFHLQALPLPGTDLPESEAKAIGRAVSDDGITWQRLPSILPPSPQETHPNDCLQRYTGCAVWRDGLAYLFYTMRDGIDCSQRIGLATSADWEHWDIRPEPVIEPDDRLLIGYGSRQNYNWGNIDCRDFMVVPKPDSSGYYGYFAAAADVGRISPVGVIAMAESDDLLHWHNQRIVFTPRQNGAVEVPDVFRLGEKWYLMFLCGNHYTGYAAHGDEEICNYTLYASADSPEGPFVEEDSNILVGGPANSATACRSLDFRGSRLLYYTDRVSDGRHTLSWPKRISALEDGSLGVYYYEGLNVLCAEPYPLRNLSAEYNTFAWRTVGGTEETSGDTVCLRTQRDSWHLTAYEEAPAAAIAFCAELEIDAQGGGFYIEGAEKLIISLQPDKQRVSIEQLFAMETVAARNAAPFDLRRCQVRLMVADNTAELYLNDRLILQCAVGIGEIRRLGFFCDRGEMKASAIRAHSLQNP